MPFYTEIEPHPGIARSYGFLFRAIEVYVAKGRELDAAAVRAVLAELAKRYERLGIDSALQADAFIRDRLRQTQVRPSTPGPHLRDKIVSRALPTTFPSAYIGIADLDVLNTAINPRTGGVYWRAQEYGLSVDNRLLTGPYAGRGGSRSRPAPGYFQPGDSRPSPGQFRMHPYFQQEPYARGMPALVRTRPLRPRNFLRDGSKLTQQWRRQRSEAIIGDAISKLRAI